MALSWLFFSFLLANLSDENQGVPLVEILVCAVLHCSLLLGLCWVLMGQQEFCARPGELVQTMRLFGLHWSRKAALDAHAQLEISADADFSHLSELAYVQIEVVSAAAGGIR